MLKVATGRSQEREPWRRRANINMRLITPFFLLPCFPIPSVCLSVPRLVSLHIFYFFSVNYKILNLKGWMETEGGGDLIKFWFFFLPARRFSANITGAHVLWRVMVRLGTTSTRHRWHWRVFMQQWGVVGSSPAPEGLVSMQKWGRRCSLLGIWTFNSIVLCFLSSSSSFFRLLCIQIVLAHVLKMSAS